MTITAAQVVGNDTISSVASISVNITPTAGSCLAVFVVNNNGVTPTVSDDQNGSYGTLKANAQWSGDTDVSLFVHENVAGAATSVTASFSPNSTYCGVIVFEITGGANPAYQTAAGLHQVAPGGATDAISSDNMNPTVQPCLLIGFSLNANANNPGDNNNVSDPGTGFTNGGVFIRWNGDPGFAAEAARAEYKRLTSTAAVAATFTANGSSAGGKDHLTVGATFTEAGAGEGTPMASIGWLTDVRVLVR
jgi:hypothetical protein